MRWAWCSSSSRCRRARRRTSVITVDRFPWQRTSPAPMWHLCERCREPTGTSTSSWTRPVVSPRRWRWRAPRTPRVTTSWSAAWPGHHSPWRRAWWSRNARPSSTSTGRCCMLATVPPELNTATASCRSRRGSCGVEQPMTASRAAGWGMGVLPRIVRGEGSYLYDADGRRYLDGSGGPAACRPRRGPAGAELVTALADEVDARRRALGPETVAAFIFEPVVGAAGGAVPAPDGYARAIRAVCDRHQVLVIADEVMCGAGRCGTWRALEHDGVVPDIMAVGKGLAGGYIPLAATIVRRTGAEPIVGAEGTVL